MAPSTRQEKSMIQTQLIEPTLVHWAPSSSARLERNLEDRHDGGKPISRGGSPPPGGANGRPDKDPQAIHEGTIILVAQIDGQMELPLSRS